MEDRRWRIATWLRRVVRWGWRVLLQREERPESPPLPLPTTSHTTIAGRVGPQVRFRIHSTPAVPLPSPPEGVAERIRATEEKFERGVFFRPLQASVERGAVITAHITQGDPPERSHYVALYPCPAEPTA